MKSIKSPLISFQDDAVTLHSPTAMPQASAFLWNPSMMIQANCRGFATAQFMQPEPAKYAHAPNLEAKTFMQPEQPYYAHHPGRFCYVKDRDNGDLFSAPYEPIKATNSEFSFVVKPHRLSWKVINADIAIIASLTLAPDRPLELWEFTVRNLSKRTRNLSITPYFPVGYQSWMNQSASYAPDLQAIVCRSITPYQKHSDYFKNKNLKDCTFLLAQTPPSSYECRQSAFEGDGGLHRPTSLEQDQLSNSEALYELPTAAMQYSISLDAGESRQYRFAFGPARDTEEIADIREELFTSSIKMANAGFDAAQGHYQRYVEQSKTPLRIDTPDAQFDHFVNHWLSRQIYYHGDVNRLSTDPQTRNFLQDTMGMSYLNATKARRAFCTALSQQYVSGQMPEGILLDAEAELKYINQVPHADHCVWLPICLSAYLDETNDYELLDESLPFADHETPASVFDHISSALRWLHQQRDDRGLHFIAEGDWCDPMNMVGYQGRGVSIWLSLAASYACKIWSDICQYHGKSAASAEFLRMSEVCNKAVNAHGWSDHWYARGITDDGALFGVSTDAEGKLFLNPQSWAMLSGAADTAQRESMIQAIDRHLGTPYGMQMLAPAYTQMREDIGRVTQKFPGSAENGSIYNHAAAFYGYALFQHKDSDRAFSVLRQMIPGSSEQDLRQRGQLPVFIPNYYRGAYKQFERTAGRSSQLFNTGTVHWFYRSLIDGLFGLRGCPQGLLVEPNLPSNWSSAKVDRAFRGATFEVLFERDHQIPALQVCVDGVDQSANIISNIESARHYHVHVRIPNEPG